ncbi:hypothetical protein GW17_00057167 [Ensete ventricosum]|nr:hypothetical protein GW17_00057167 [Ensete ventricosum]
MRLATADAQPNHPRFHRLQRSRRRSQPTSMATSASPLPLESASVSSTLLGRSRLTTLLTPSPSPGTASLTSYLLQNGVDCGDSGSVIPGSVCIAFHYDHFWHMAVH